MSSDNYYLVRKHPNGGYTATDECASSAEVSKVRENAPQFRTSADAWDWASMQYSEYGVQLDENLRLPRRSIYIAGPMRGYTHDNFHTFDRAKALLVEDGWAVVSPADLDREFCGYDPLVGVGEQVKFEEAIERDLAAILSCTAIALLPGWWDSRGVAVELSFALATDKQVYEFDPSLSSIRRRNYAIDFFEE